MEIIEWETIGCLFLFWEGLLACCQSNSCALFNFNIVGVNEKRKHLMWGRSRVKLTRKIKGNVDRGGSKSWNIIIEGYSHPKRSDRKFKKQKIISIHS